jgi:hypothetical protein
MLLHHLFQHILIIRYAPKVNGFLPVSTINKGLACRGLLPVSTINRGKVCRGLLSLRSEAVEVRSKEISSA